MLAAQVVGWVRADAGENSRTMGSSSTRLIQNRFKC